MFFWLTDYSNSLRVCLKVNNEMFTAIPRWICQLPSEHWSQAASGAVSTWMGDRLGTPRAVNFFLPVQLACFLTPLHSVKHTHHRIDKKQSRFKRQNTKFPHHSVKHCEFCCIRSKHENLTSPLHHETIPVRITKAQNSRLIASNIANFDASRPITAASRRRPAA